MEEPGLLKDLPGKSLRPNRRDAQGDGPLKFVNPSLQIQSFGSADASASVTTKATSSVKGKALRSGAPQKGLQPEGTA